MPIYTWEIPGASRRIFSYINVDEVILFILKSTFPKKSNTFW